MASHTPALAASQSLLGGCQVPDVLSIRSSDLLSQRKTLTEPGGGRSTKLPKQGASGQQFGCEVTLQISSQRQRDGVNQSSQTTPADKDGQRRKKSGAASRKRKRPRGRPNHLRGWRSSKERFSWPTRSASGAHTGGPLRAEGRRSTRTRGANGGQRGQLAGRTAHQFGILFGAETDEMWETEVEEM